MAKAKSGGLPGNGGGFRNQVPQKKLEEETAMVSLRMSENETDKLPKTMMSKD